MWSCAIFQSVTFKLTQLQIRTGRLMVIHTWLKSGTDVSLCFCRENYPKMEKQAINAEICGSKQNIKHSVQKKQLSFVLFKFHSITLRSDVSDAPRPNMDFFFLFHMNNKLLLKLLLQDVFHYFFFIVYFFLIFSFFCFFFCLKTQNTDSSAISE